MSCAVRGQLLVAIHLELHNLIYQMTTRFLYSFCLLTVILSSCEPQNNNKTNVTENNIGEQFELSNIVDTIGNFIKLDFSKSEINIIDFWNNSCAPCIEEMKQFPNLLKDKKSKVSIFSISVNQFWLWKNTLSEHKNAFSFLSNSTANWRQYNLMTADNPKFKNTFSFDRLAELDSVYGVKGNPAYFVLDSTGKIISRPQSAVEYLKGM